MLSRFGPPLALTVSLLAGCGGGSGTTAPESPNRIAYTVNRSGFGEIWIMDADGSNARRVTEAAPARSDAAGAHGPALSPDGTRIAYASSGDAIEEDQDAFDLYVVDAAGGDPERLTDDDVLDGRPAWSPDAERLAFMHFPDGTENPHGVIAVMDADGGNRTELTSPEADVFVSHPDWSPDGERIAFTRGPFAAPSIHVMDADGSNSRRIVEDGLDPDWSPDGERILFTSYRDRFGRTCFHDCCPAGEIYVANADGSDPRRLTKTEASDQSAAWSPDGTEIVFVSDRSNPDEHAYELYVMDADGSNVRRLTTTDVWDGEPDWR